MRISIVAAVGRNGELGKDNKLLWNMPADMARFRWLTAGTHVVMGRRTFESIGKPLPGRCNHVLSGNSYASSSGITLARAKAQPDDAPPFYVYPSLESALFLIGSPAKESVRNPSEEPKKSDEVFIIGGRSVYERALLFADRLYLTRIDGAFEADTYFPNIDFEDWHCLRSDTYPPDDLHQYGYTFQTFMRIRNQLKVMGVSSPS
jgi:dihydrofolate reductase